MTSAPTLSHPGHSSATRIVRAVDLAGSAGRLEALLNEGAVNAPVAALVCHPHPSGGGTLHNKVVYHAMKAMNAAEFSLGWPVLRFNFRGVGRSKGEHDGRAEAEDVLAACAWLENEYNLPLVVVGFSFGAAMSLAACNRQSNVRALAALGLPTHATGREYHYRFLRDCSIPKLFVSGDHDQYAPVEELMKVTRDAAEPKQVVIIPGSDHFFTGHLKPMQDVLPAWLKEQVL